MGSLGMQGPARSDHVERAHSSQESGSHSAELSGGSVRSTSQHVIESSSHSDGNFFQAVFEIRSIPIGGHRFEVCSAKRVFRIVGGKAPAQLPAERAAGRYEMGAGSRVFGTRRRHQNEIEGIGNVARLRRPIEEHGLGADVGQCIAQDAIADTDKSDPLRQRIRQEEPPIQTTGDS
jgi:hypothetical protein